MGIFARGAGAGRRRHLMNEPLSRFARQVVPVTSIFVREGFDRDLSPHYIDLLAEIVSRYGLRDAITVTTDGGLVAGARWLAAVRKLGWETVEVAVVVDTP